MDKDISKYLKALDDTVSYDNIDPLQRDNNNIYMIIGKKGSGKSTLILNMLRSKQMYRRHYNNIFLVSPSAMRDEKFKKLCEELDEDGKCYEECNYDVLAEIEEKIKAFNDEWKAKKKKKRPHNLLILDDCISDLNKNSAIKNLINRIVLNSRHLKLSIWIVSQKYKMVNTAIRANADMITYFNNNNEMERKALEDAGVDVGLLDRLDKPSDFLHVITRGKGKYFINFKPVLSVKDTKANNPPYDKAHGGYVRGDLKNDNDSVLCILQSGEIVLPRKVIDDKMIDFLEKEKGYDHKTGEFKKEKE